MDKFSEEDQGKGDADTATISSSIARWTAPQENQEPPTVLEPEHPLMQKFQEALKNYLVKENERVHTQILELKGNLKKNKHDYTLQMSQEMYNLEQEVEQQRNTIQQYENTLESVVKLREERGDELRKSRKIFKEKAEKLDKKKNEDMEMRGELDALNLLNKQYESWQNETDCELAVSQRISEKMAVEKEEKAQKQRDLDMMLYKLTTEVWNFESKLSLVEEQTNIKNQEMEAIGTRLSDSTADLEALRTEHARLLQTWMSVITHIQRRDQIYTQLNDEYIEMQSNFLVMNAEIEGIKKEIANAMQHHENIIVQKDRANFDLTNCQRLVKIDTKKIVDLEASIQETTMALEITEKELQQANMENTNITNTMKVLLREIEKLTQAKLNLELETLEQLQARLCSDKATETTAAAIRKMKEDAKKLEISLLSSENHQAKLSLQIEQQKERNEKFNHLTEEDRKICQQKEADVSKMDNVFKETLLNIDRKQTNLEILNRKINTLLEQLQGVEKSPTQRKVDDLEKNISDATTKVKELQQDWLRIQGRVVNLAEQQQAQASEINLTRKQIQVLEHKNIKLESEINQLMQEEAAMQRCLAAIQSRVEQLFQQRSEDRKHNQELEATYNHLALEYMAQLKDAQEETMKIEEEITELEEEKEQLALDLHKVGKEAMSWQKMIILAIETKQKILNEKGSGSEVGKMKLEIHRMQVRQAQLSRLATRLAEELAQGVARRELAASKSVSDPRKRRLALPNALRDKRNEINKVHQEIEINKSMLDTLMKEEQFLQQEFSEKLVNITEVENHISSLKIKVEEMQISKQKNLEKLVRWQRCAQQWSAVAAGRGLSMSRTSEHQMELDQQSHLKRILKVVTNSVLNQPQLEATQRGKLYRILNTLTLEDEQDTRSESDGNIGSDCQCSPSV